MAAEQAKDRGNRAFAAGNYTDAISSFTEAIALHAKDGTSMGKEHVYYSNRSAAYLKLGDGQRALADADKCIAIKRDWPKGYSRKGAALYHLTRYADAYRAYKDGLALEATNQALLEGLRSVEVKMAAPPSGSAGQSYSTASSSTPSSASVAGKSLRTFLVGDKAAVFQLFQFVMRSLLFTTFLLYWMPLAVPAHVAFATFFKVALLNNLSYLMFTHGLPKWQAAYAQRLVLDPTTQSFFFCLIFWVSAPYSMALVPVFMLEMVHFFAYLSNLLTVLRLSNSPLVTTITTKALNPLVAAIISDPSWPALPAQAKLAKLYHRMPLVAANVEVAIGMSLLVELLTPARNFLLVILYWQLLRVRYMISPQLQEAFRNLNALILRVVYHPRCPTVIASVYTKIQAFAFKLVDPSQQQAGGGGMASRCNIM